MLGIKATIIYTGCIPVYIIERRNQKTLNVIQMMKGYGKSAADGKSARTHTHADDALMN
jgi:hypothetical protein